MPKEIVFSSPTEKKIQLSGRKAKSKENKLKGKANGNKKKKSGKGEKRGLEGLLALTENE